MKLSETGDRRDMEGYLIDARIFSYNISGGNEHIRQKNKYPQISTAKHL